jgi:hypothetical protein
MTEYWESIKKIIMKMDEVVTEGEEDYYEVLFTRKFAYFKGILS